MIAPAIVLFTAFAVGVSFAPLPAAWIDALFYACWASVIVTALSVHLPRGLPVPLALALAANAGLWAGAVIAVAGAPLDLAKSLPIALLAFPIAWLAAHRLSIVVKVVASWLVAVSVLAAALPVTTPTPGYAGDHME